MRFERDKGHPLRGTSIWARESIAVSVAECVERAPLSDDEKREKRRWSHEINKTTQGYIIAWILRLGGYID